MNEMDDLRLKCWDAAVHDFGTAYIFEKRARSLRLRLHILTFLGIMVPVAVGGLILAYGTQFKYFGFIQLSAGGLGVAQLVASVWSLVAKWDDEYAYALESTSANYDLASRYEDLAAHPPAEHSDFYRRLEFLELENKRRSDLDYRHSISDKEKRKGMRAGLRNYKRKCSACGVVPTSMKPSKCDVCGQF